MKKSKKIYMPPPITAKNELEKLQKVAYLFSCHRKLSGKSSKVIREKLLILLSLYLKDGFNSATKEKASKILKVDKSIVNSMNLELRKENMLIQDKYNIRINYLNEDLKLLKSYVESEGEDVLFVFRVKDA